MKKTDWASKILIGLSVLFLLVANFSFWVSNNIYNAANFQNNVLTVFRKQETRDAIASEIVDRILSENPGLKQIVDSPAQSAISGLLASPFLNPVIEKVSEKLQNYIVTGQNEVSIDLAPVNNVLTAISRATSGQDQAPQIKNTDIVIFPANAFPHLNSWLKPLTTIGWPLAFIGFAILAFLFVRSGDKFKMLREFGWFFVGGGALNILLVPFASSLIPIYVTNSNAAIVASQVFSIFSQSYLRQLFLVTLFGLIILLVGYLWPQYKKNKK